MPCLLAGMFVPGVVRASPASDADWHDRFARARTALVEEHFDRAEMELAALAQNAPAPEDARAANELMTVAREGEARRAEPSDSRTSDELAVLYATAVFYGLGSSAWVALQLQPESFGAAILPFAVITPAAVGAVALADDFRPLRHGVPHAIAAGLYLGFGEGLWLTAYQHAYAEHHTDTDAWKSERVSTVLWASSTTGAVVGGLIGGLRRPTPGRVSLTASATIWGGVLSAMAASALAPTHDERAEYAYLVGGIGYNAGLLGGMLFGPSVAPSVARVRLLDLGGLGGGLLGGGVAALATNELGSRETLGIAAIGSGLGLTLTWLATAGMPPDRSHDELRPAFGSEARPSLTVRTGITPVPGGMMATVSGALW